MGKWSTSSTPSISVDTSDLQRFSRVLRREAPRMALRLNRQLKAAGEIVAADAREKVAPYSQSTVIKVRRRGTYIAVEATSTNQNGAISGLLEEGNKGSKGGAGTFRHPVFGKGGWADQQMHPFLLPALQDKGNEAVEVAAVAVDETLRGIAVDRLAT